MKKYFIINYPDLKIGGIQRIIYNYFHEYINKGYVAVWVSATFPDYDEGFGDVLDKVTIVQKRLAHEMFARISKNDFCVILAFDLPNFVFNQVLKQKFKLNANNILIIPNLIGNGVKLEDKNDLRAFNVLSNFYSNLYDNGNLLFCDSNQEIALLKHYKIDSKITRKNRLIPYKVKINNLDEKSLCHHYESNNIITVSRFDFPHKAYLIGLIKSFAEIKIKYPKLKLVIIGDGNGADELKHTIKSCDDYIKKDIILVGSVSYNKLPEYFIDAKVFVGLAGAVYDAVRYGLPSIIVRHYSYDCEAYGCYHDNYNKVVSTEKGIDVSIFISDILNLSKEEYVLLAKKEYSTYFLHANNTNEIEFSDIRFRKELYINKQELNTLNDIISKYLKIRIQQRNKNILKNPISSIVRIGKRILKKFK